MGIEAKIDICKSCGKTIGSSERAIVVDGNLLCFKCEQNQPNTPETMKMPVMPEKDPIAQNPNKKPNILGRIFKIVCICSPLLCFGSMLVADALLVWRGGRPIGFIGTTALYMPGSFPKSIDSKELNIGLIAIIAGLCLTLWLARVRSKDNMLWIDKCRWAVMPVPLIVVLLLGVGIGYLLGWIAVVVLVSLVFLSLRTQNLNEKWFWVSIISVSLCICLGLMFRYEIKKTHWFTSNHEVESIEGDKFLVRDRYGSAGSTGFLIPSNTEP